MAREAPEHLQRRRLAGGAALPPWAAGKFTESQRVVLRTVGLEMLNKHGVCALRLNVIVASAGVSVGTAREALMIADTIGLVTVEHLRGYYVTYAVARPTGCRRFVSWRSSPRTLSERWVAATSK